MACAHPRQTWANLEVPGATDEEAARVFYCAVRDCPDGIAAESVLVGHARIGDEASVPGIAVRRIDTIIGPAWGAT